MNDLETDVLIVGGGPVGLAASIALSCHGVRSLLVERHPGTTRHPKASVVSSRTMELFRQWDIEPAVRAGGVPPDDARAVVWATALAGIEIGRLTIGDAETIARYLAHGPAPLAICAQDVVEPLLLERARRSPCAELRYGTALEDFTQDADGVTATVQEQGSGARMTVQARYLVAADGHASGARSRLGIATEGPAPLGHMVNVHFTADLTPWTAGRAAILYWIVNPDVVGVFIALNGRDRWLFNLPYDPDRECADDYPADRCVAILRRAAGVPALAPRIESVTTWTMRRQIAARYRDGRVFLAGDAAHQFPPTGGFGMNCGIQDAHNLAWKLAGVLRGWAGPALLDTYDRERRPVASFYAEQSSANAETIAADMRPVAVIEDAGPDGEAFRSMIAAGIPGQRRHFDSEGLALGFHYDSTAVVPDGTPPPSPDDPVRDYVPVARPGHRAPHAWVAHEGRTVSTLDLFDGRFVLLTAAAASPWRDAAAEVASATEIPLACPVLAAGEADWLGAYGLEEDGAVLVRPDGHVGWRAPGAVPDPRTVLHVAMRGIVGRAKPSQHGEEAT